MTRLTEQGVKDTLAGLHEVKKAVEVRLRRAEREIGEVEAELIALRKISGFIEIQIADRQAELRAIDDAKHR